MTRARGMGENVPACAPSCAACAGLRAELTAERAARMQALRESRDAWLLVELLLLARMPAWPTAQ